jgi:hypothetical protein
VRIESIVTSLVFDHALRIRLKASTEGTGETPAPTRPASRAASAATAHDTESSEADTLLLAHERGDASEGASTAVAGEGAVEQAGKKGSDVVVPQEGGGAGKADNLVGLINDLVTSDLANITEGRSFLLCCESLLSIFYDERANDRAWDSH